MKLAVFFNYVWYADNENDKQNIVSSTDLCKVGLP
jgi:hypothetical protein